MNIIVLQHFFNAYVNLYTVACNEWSSVACNRTIRRLFCFLCSNYTFLHDNNIQKVDTFHSHNRTSVEPRRNGSFNALSIQAMMMSMKCQKIAKLNRKYVVPESSVFFENIHQIVRLTMLKRCLCNATRSSRWKLRFKHQCVGYSSVYECRS